MNVKWFSYHVEKVFFAHITSPGDTQVWEQPAWTPASTACSSQHTYKPHVKDRYSEKGTHLQCKQNQIKAFCQFKTSSSKKKCIKFPEVQTCCSIKTPTQSQNRQICKSFNSSLLLYLNCASVYQSKCLALLQKLAGFTKQGGKMMPVSKTSKTKALIEQHLPLLEYHASPESCLMEWGHNPSVLQGLTGLTPRV